MWIIFALILVGCEVSESSGPVDTGDFEAVLLEDGGPYPCSNDSDTMFDMILIDPETDVDETVTIWEVDPVLEICSNGTMYVWCHEDILEGPGTCGRTPYNTCEVYEGKWQCVTLCDIVTDERGLPAFDCSEFDTKN